MNIGRRKAWIIGGSVAGVLAAGGTAAFVYATFFGDKTLRYQNQAALLAATPYIATGELVARGLPLSTPLACWSMRDAEPQKLRVACAGQTIKRQRVQVLASGEKQTVRQYFTILVDGRPLLQNASCMGADCRSGRG